MFFAHCRGGRRNHQIHQKHQIHQIHLLCCLLLSSYYELYLSIRIVEGVAEAGAW